MGRYEDALTMHRKCLQIFTMTDGEKCGHNGDVWCNMGIVYMHEGKMEEALSAHQESVSIKNLVYGEDSKTFAISCSNLANVYSHMGKSEDALRVRREVLRIYTMKCQPDCEEVAVSHLNVGASLYDMGLEDEARASLEISLGIYRRVHGENHPNVANVLFNFGVMLRNGTGHGRSEDCLKLFKKALKIQRKTLKGPHQKLCNTLIAIGNIYLHDQKYYAKASRKYDELLDLVDPGTARNLVDICFNNLTCKMHLKDYQGALKMSEKVVGACTKLGIADCEMAKTAAANVPMIKALLA